MIFFYEIFQSPQASHITMISCALIGNPVDFRYNECGGQATRLPHSIHCAGYIAFGKYQTIVENLLGLHHDQPHVCNKLGSTCSTKSQYTVSVRHFGNSLMTIHVIGITKGTCPDVHSKSLLVFTRESVEVVFLCLDVFIVSIENVFFCSVKWDLNLSLNNINAGNCRLLDSIWSIHLTNSSLWV